ncbi:uncharacterized protein LOC130589894 [Beta vulgaris subsp. vulgaris]|uniref:uncharacterized protein LOC130589894 n=1 Tax=Beta vulgaris subsp. vulgaris TaxID=3555 RepID=UPI002547BB42|nr:uncharacterized protein LOC130589894 [Beta vulgaris subsp. vulgaris]
MDSSWIDLPKGHPAYYNGCMKFLELAKETLVEGKTQCPCNNCKLNKWFKLEKVGGHILFHQVGNNLGLHSDQAKGVGRDDDIDGLLKAAFRIGSPQPTNEPSLLSELDSDDEDLNEMHEESSSFILSLIIPGKYGPGIDIDVYLQPLIHELKLLWEGVDAFDVYSGKKFKLRAALHSTINDFPAYAMLSGWSTKANLFDGKKEYGLAPVPASGTEILKQLEEVNYVYGKSKTISRRQEVGTSNNEIEDDEEYMPPAAYNMCKEDKERFLKVLKKLRVPDGYGSNLQRCKICSTAIDKGELDTIQSNLVLTLCKMEKEFLPTFFTIMVHLLIHLVDEVKLGGPVHYRWMYPIERYLAFLKSHVSNKAQPEGSIAEGFLLWETITFCSRYLESVETMFTRPKRNDDGAPHINNYLYNSCGRVVGKRENVCLDDKSLKQAHRYVLLHSDEMKPVHNLDDSTQEGKLRKALAGGLSNRGERIKSFVINGYKFDTVDRERFRKTQNSGVMVEADGQVYYGKLKDIFELDYFGSFKVVMFRCDWVDIRRGCKTYPSGRVTVNFSKLMHTGRNLPDDPFVFSSQAKQVFYVEDEIQKGWLHVIKTKPRDLFDIPDDDEILE